MARKHFIEHVNGNQWLAPYGFVASRESALQFPTEQDAKQYLEDNPNLKRAGHKTTAGEINEVIGRFAGQVKTDYSPWGHNG